MKRTVLALAILSAMTFVIGSIDPPAQGIGLVGNAFAQEVITRREVVIRKTVPPGPSDEEVITREQTITQETRPAPPSRVVSEVVVRQPPPPPRQEIIVTAPTPQYVWVAGYWGWNNGWVWVPGHWELPPQRLAQRVTTWVPGQWVQRGLDWIWQPGHWE